jgi:molybdate transport system substrate-binding protein
MKQLRVFSTMAVQGAVEELIPAFEKAHGVKLAVTWNTAPALVKRLQAGERGDLLILNRAGMDTMQTDGRIAAGTEMTLASSPVAVAIRKGASRPDISTPDGFVRALRAAKAISYSMPSAGGASGIYFGKLIERLGIADEINAKTKFPPAGGLTASFLPTGEVELAIQQTPELLAVPGIEILGTLPGDLHMVTVFVAGIEKTAAEPTLAKALVDFLRMPEAARVFRAKGLDLPA